MRHDIIYRDHPARKKQCDDVMLNELNNLEPENWRKSIDKSALGTIIGARSRLGLSVKWRDNLVEELHKPIQRKFKNKFEFVTKTDIN